MYTKTYHSGILVLHVVAAGAIAVTTGQFSETSLPVLVGDLSCIGTETGILLCQYGSGTDTSCSLSEDAGIVCQGIHNYYYERKARLHQYPR